MSQADHIDCPPSIVERVRNFTEHLTECKSGDYSEAQLRIDFLNPMLEAPGWDVNNTAGYAEAYRDVVYEDHVKIAGASKAPDYGFYISGRASSGGRKFFLETKNPAVNSLVGPRLPYPNMSVSILATFDDFVVCETRVKPALPQMRTRAQLSECRPEGKH